MSSADASSSIIFSDTSSTGYGYTDDDDCSTDGEGGEGVGYEIEIGSTTHEGSDLDPAYEEWLHKEEVQELRVWELPKESELPRPKPTPATESAVTVIPAFHYPTRALVPDRKVAHIEPPPSPSRLLERTRSLDTGPSASQVSLGGRTFISFQEERKSSKNWFKKGRLSRRKSSPQLKDGSLGPDTVTSTKWSTATDVGVAI
ncbi:hypothetical protein C8J56DRAFT_894246 [Mycena floridula]|nr:hypothetical protein C8J56DRAFT_894246 [Mycena floridula]